MKVLCCVSDPRYPFAIRGVGHVFRALGHQFIEWDIRQKPAFDAFDEYEPNIYIGPLPATSWVIKGLGSINKCRQERKGRIKSVYLHEIPDAADTFDFVGGVRDPALETDVSYVGVYEPSIHRGVFEALEAKRLRYKICGSERWPIPQYLGPIAVETIKHLYASSKVSLNFRGKERIYQILMAGGCPVSYPVGPPFDHNNLLTVDPGSPESFANFAEAMCSDRKDCTRDHIIEEGRAVIRQGNTYFHRVATLFDQWGMRDEAKRVLQLYNETVTI